MENINNFSAEELKKCPYHQMLAEQNNSGQHENENNGGWAEIDPKDQDGTSPNRYEKSGNDSSDDAASTGSAAANS